MRTAVQHLSDRETPDYRNAIKEAVSAVEALINELGGDAKSDFSVKVNRLIPEPALSRSLSAFFGWASDGKGIRHALKDNDTPDFHLAKFAVVMASAFINYLKAIPRP